MPESCISFECMENCLGSLKTERESILYSIPKIPWCFFFFFFNLRRIFFALTGNKHGHLLGFTQFPAFIYRMTLFPENSYMIVVKHSFFCSLFNGIDHKLQLFSCKPCWLVWPGGLVLNQTDK